MSSFRCKTLYEILGALVHSYDRISVRWQWQTKMYVYLAYAYRCFQKWRCRSKLTDVHAADRDWVWWHPINEWSFGFGGSLLTSTPRHARHWRHMGGRCRQIVLELLDYYSVTDYWAATPRQQQSELSLTASQLINKCSIRFVAITACFPRSCLLPQATDETTLSRRHLIFWARENHHHCI